MTKLTRRNFLDKSFHVAAGSIVLGSTRLITSCTTGQDIRLYIPIPVQVVIDDVGWWSGEDGSKRQEPYRTGISRNHVPADYQAIADLGKALGIRPQAAFILCEWDKDNILRKVPTSTWMGTKWDNSKRVGPWFEEAAAIIRANRDHFELTLHGIGHEYWEGGAFTRAEWTDSNGQMRPEDQVELHLGYFGKLMDQHNLGSFPTSFVPAAFRHSFGPSSGRKISLAQILEKHGIDYINTPFSSIYNRDRIQYGDFGFDSGVMTIDRGNDEFPWLTFPADPQAELSGPTCGMHWPNLLHPEPERNHETVEKWINYLKPYNEREDMMLAPDSLRFRQQLGHHTLTKARINRNMVELDFSETDKLPGNIAMGEFVLKMVSGRPRQFSSAEIKITKQTLQEGSRYLYILNLERRSEDQKVSIKLV